MVSTPCWDDGQEEEELTGYRAQADTWDYRRTGPAEGGGTSAPAPSSQQTCQQPQ